jgi:hypothetical protein
MLNSAFFDTHKPHIMKKKILDPYLVLDLSSGGHLAKKLFVAIFGTFYKN